MCENYLRGVFYVHANLNNIFFHVIVYNLDFFTQYLFPRYEHDDKPACLVNIYNLLNK